VALLAACLLLAAGGDPVPRGLEIKIAEALARLRQK